MIITIGEVISIKPVLTQWTIACILYNTEISIHIDAKDHKFFVNFIIPLMTFALSAKL